MAASQLVDQSGSGMAEDIDLEGSLVTQQKPHLDGEVLQSPRATSLAFHAPCLARHS